MSYQHTLIRVTQMEKKIKRQIISCAGEKAEQLKLSSLAVEKAKQPRNFEKHFEQIEEFDSFL